LCIHLSEYSYYKFMTTHDNQISVFSNGYKINVFLSCLFNAARIAALQYVYVAYPKTSGLEGGFLCKEEK